MKRLAPWIVGLGAISYGIPASLFKLAGRVGVQNGPLLFWSFLSSAVILTLVHMSRGRRLKTQGTSWRQVLLVMAAGTASGFTNTFYILALRSIPVAVAAVMLMQSVWLSVLLGAIIKRQWPSRRQVLSIVLVLAGTVLAADLLPITTVLSGWGLLFSFLAAVAYAGTLQFTASLGNNLEPLTKTWLLCVGALGLIIVAWGPQLINVPFSLVAVKWGVLTACFSMILPLACYARFMPLVPLGGGPILSSLELPASIVVAFLLLGERVSWLQLVGVVVIIGAVIFANRPGHRA